MAKSRTLRFSLDLPGLVHERPLGESKLSILTLDDALAGVLDNSVQPSGETEARLCNLLGDDGDSRFVVGAGDFLVPDGLGPVGDDGGADESVCVRGPDHYAVDGLLGFQALGPCPALLLVHAALDLTGQVGGPHLGRGEGVVADQLLRDRRVPCGMQVRSPAVEGHVDQVAADFEVLDVQRLVDVADEVDHPLESLLLLNEADVFGHGAGGVVGDGADDASFFSAVALVVDVALLGRAVESINVVERRAESPFVGGAVAVGLVFSLVSA